MLYTCAAKIRCEGNLKSFAKFFGKWTPKPKKIIKVLGFWVFFSKILHECWRRSLHNVRESAPTPSPPAALARSLVPTLPASDGPGDRRDRARVPRCPAPCKVCMTLLVPFPASVCDFMHLNPRSDPKNFAAARRNPTPLPYRGVAVFVRVTSSRLHVSIWLELRL